MSTQFRPRARSRNRRKAKRLHGGYRAVFDGAVRDAARAGVFISDQAIHAASRLPDAGAVLKSLYVDEVRRAVNDQSVLLGREAFGTPGQRAARRAYRR